MFVESVTQQYYPFDNLRKKKLKEHTIFFQEAQHSITNRLISHVVVFRLLQLVAACLLLCLGGIIITHNRTPLMRRLSLAAELLGDTAACQLISLSFYCAA